jgi:hypothetical protein
VPAKDYVGEDFGDDSIGVSLDKMPTAAAFITAQRRSMCRPLHLPDTAPLHRAVTSPRNARSGAGEAFRKKDVEQALRWVSHMGMFQEKPGEWETQFNDEIQLLGLEVRYSVSS